MKIAILSSSVRDGRMSHRVALFLSTYLAGRGFEVDVIDLKAYDFPIFSERYAMQNVRCASLEEFTQRFNNCDALWIVSPIYNSSYPASLKNVIDLYYKEWFDKVVAISVVTSGAMAPLTAVEKLQSLLYKLGAKVAVPPHTVINVGSEFDENGTPANMDAVEKLLTPTLKRLLL